MFTRQSKFSSRFTYKDRDVLKGISIQRIRTFNVDNENLDDTSETVQYRVITSSYPQYKPYIDLKGSRSKKQRKVKHQYQCTFEINASMSITSRDWTMRCGSEKNLYTGKAPQSQVKQIYRRTLKGWQKEASRRFTTKREQNAFIKKKKEKHQKRAPYLNQGDWIAGRLGINLDFLYRQSYARKIAGHIYGRDIAMRPSKLNPRNTVFFTKHEIRLIEVLLKAGILKG